MMNETPGRTFWDFSLRVYAAPGVQQECLALQELWDLDVNLLLFAAFAGARLDLALSARDLMELVAETESWHAAVVRRLRAVRTDMKRWSEDAHDPLAAEATTLRLAVKQAELDAERFEQERLARWAQGRRGNAASARQRTIENNIRLVLGHYTESRGSTAELPMHLIAAALD